MNDQQKVWFLLFLAPLAFAFILLAPIDNILLSAVAIALLSASFLISKYNLRLGISSGMWITIACSLLLLPVLLYFLKISQSLLLFSLFIFAAWSGIAAFMISRKHGYTNLIILSIAPAVCSFLLSIIPSYILSASPPPDLIALSLCNSFLVAAFILMHKMIDQNSSNVKPVIFLSTFLNLAGFLSIIIVRFLYSANNSLLLILLLSYYSFRTIKLLMLNKAISPLLVKRAYNLGIYSWFFSVIFLSGQRIA